MSVNVGGTQLLLDMCAAAGVRAFVYTSSCGKPPPLIQNKYTLIPGSADAVVVNAVPAVMEVVDDEGGGWSHADARHGVYHSSKVDAELACAAADAAVAKSLPNAPAVAAAAAAAAAAASSMRVIIMRPPGIYGERSL